MRLIVVLILLLAFAASLNGEEIRGKVVGIADGDTITVLDAGKVQHKIRLEGIDAPEKGQAFGTKSKEAMSEKVGGEEVVVRWEKKDRYGRILGDVYLGDRHINLEMVEDGLAWHYKQYSKAKALAEAEDAAREGGKGEEEAGASIGVAFEPRGDPPFYQNSVKFPFPVFVGSLDDAIGWDCSTSGHSAYQRWSTPQQL